MLTGSVVSKFHAMGALQASYVRTNFSTGASEATARRLLLGQGAQAAQRAMLRHAYRSW